MPRLGEEGAERARGGVQSIGRGFAIIEEIARNRDGIGLAELSKRVGLHNSTTFHLVKTLVSLGYVRQLKDSKRYRIGRPLFALAASALDEIEMMSLATPVLDDLARATGESAHFSVPMGDAVVVLARTSGPGAFQLTDRVGVVRPAHCTALGKIMLAALAPGQFERYLQRAELKAHTPKSITSAERLAREIAEVRRAGLAIDDGEFDPELRCVALPVRDFSGRVIGAIGISGPVWRLSIEALQKRARAGARRRRPPVGRIRLSAAKRSARQGGGLDRERRQAMPRHANYVPHGVIPAVLLPFENDLSIDEASFRKHLRDVAAVEGLSAVTINAHSTEVASCTFDEQRRVLDIAQDEIGGRLPLINGIWADGSLEAARHRAHGGRRAAPRRSLVFPPAPFTLGQSPAMALAHFKRIADATDLPLIVFQYPLATGQGYPKDTLLKLCEEVPTIRAIKDWIGNVPHHEWHIRTLQSLPRPVNVLTTHSSWLLLVAGARPATACCRARAA